MIITNRNLPRVGLSNVGFPQPYRGASELFEDFVGWGQSMCATGAGAAPWRVVGTNGAAADFTPVIPVTADGAVEGQINVTVSAVNADGSFAQLNSATFLCTTGRVMEFVVRFRPDSITTTTAMFGMYALTTDPVGTQPQGFGFRIVNGALGYEVKNAGTTLAVTSTGVTLTASTTSGWVRLRAVWDGQSAIRFYKDDVLLATYTAAAIPTGIWLSPLFGIQVTAGTASDMNVDYIGCSVEAGSAAR